MRNIALALLVACSPSPRSKVTSHGGPRSDGGASPRTPSTPNPAFEALLGDDWEHVFHAAETLRADPHGSVPYLVAGVEDDRVKALRNTADLYYPGAKKFYGHGYMLPYDVDHVGDRAGWVLEELLFRDFGFRSGLKREDPDKAAQRRT